MYSINVTIYAYLISSNDLYKKWLENKKEVISQQVHFLYIEVVKLRTFPGYRVAIKYPIFQILSKKKTLGRNLLFHVILRL